VESTIDDIRVHVGAALNCAIARSKEVYLDHEHRQEDREQEVGRDRLCHDPNHQPVRAFEADEASEAEGESSGDP